MGAFTKLFGNTILENLAVGTTASTAKFTIKGNGSTSATTALLIQNSSNSTIFSVDDIGNSAVSGLLTLAQGNFLQPSGNTAVWFSDGNTPLRIVRTFALLNLDNNGGLTLGSGLNCSTVSVSLNADSGAGVYTGLFTTITNGINRNMNNANRQVLGLTSTGGGSVQNAPKLSFLEISRGTVTGYAAYVGIDVVDCEVRLNSTSGNTLIGSSPSNTAKLSIKGSGSTNATKALRVENSLGNSALEVFDNRDVQASTNLTVLNTFTAGQNTGIVYNHNLYAGLGSVNISRLDTYASSYTLGVGSGPYDMGNNNAQLYVYGPSGWGTNATLARFATSNIRPSTYMIDVGNGGSTTTVGSMARFHTINPVSINAGGSAVQSFAGLDIKFKGQTYDYSQPVNTSISSILFNNELNNLGFGVYTAYLGVRDIDISSSYANFASPYTAIDIRPSFTGTPSGSNVHVGININPTLGVGYNFIALKTTIGGAYFNTSSVNASAIIQADSTTQGFLPPRMTSAQKIAIVSPAEGLMVYDTDLKRPCFHDGTNWITL